MQGLENMFLKDIWPKVLKLYPQARLTLTAGDCENAWQFLENDVVDLLIVKTRSYFQEPLDFILSIRYVS